VNTIDYLFIEKTTSSSKGLNIFVIANKLLMSYVSGVVSVAQLSRIFSPFGQC